MTVSLSLQDRYRGCLLGLAVGDALGAPLEFRDRSEIERDYGRLREMIGGGWLNTVPGEYTDDTQMTLGIARSVAELGRIDPADIARHFVAWYQTKPKDIGNTTARSIRYLVDGLPWDEAGERTTREMAGEDASNGSLMRTAPVALVTRQDPDALIRLSLDVSRITHANPLATWSCVALDKAIVALLADDDDVLGAAEDVESAEVRQAVRSVESLSRDGLSSGGYVLDTLRCSLWSLLRHDTFEEVVVEAVNLGGDADTTGAVAGALAGTRYGMAGIPARWLDVLQEREALQALADRLLEVSESPADRA